MDYSDLVKALRRCDMRQGCFNANCRYSVGKYFCDMDKVHKDAAAAIEALNRLLDQNTQRCEGLRKQLREAHESYERHLNDLEAQMPKRGEIVRCGECVHCYAEGFAHERNICEKHPELGNVPDDWFCADGEREVQE